MSEELRLKKLRGSGGYVMARVTDAEQAVGNLGGPDLFLAPLGRIDSDRIARYLCNTCEKEFDGDPSITYDTLNETVADNLILKERGKYACRACDAAIAEYRVFEKPDESQEVGLAKPAEQTQQTETPAEPTVENKEHHTQQTETPAEQNRPHTETINTIQGMEVYDEEAKKAGTAKQVGIDAEHNVVLIVDGDGGEVVIKWDRVKKIGDIILVGGAQAAARTTQPEPGKCQSCGFSNRLDAKFCEECGTKV